MEIKQVPIKQLKFSEYNPRKFNEKQLDDVKESLKRFGFVEPIVVNSNPDRFNIIIGGHLRVRAAKLLDYEEIPVAYVNIPDIKKEKELNLRLNKNLGDWDWELLADFDEEILFDVGFTDAELKKNINEEIEPEIRFAEELMEAHNYIILYFDNEMDWLNLQTLYPLEKRKFTDKHGTFERTGLVRVVKGTDFLNKIRKQ